MSDLKEFKLPDVGEGLTEADIVRWHVHPGDQVTVNQIIVEIETAKAVVELPSPYAGVVADLLVPEGATADVGTPIISVNVGGSPAGPGEREIAETADLVPLAAVELASEPGMIGSPAPKAERQAVLVGYGVKLGTTARRARKAASAAPAREAAAPQAAPAPAPVAPPAPSVNGDGARALAKPPVRKMARDLGVDLAVLAGTGPGGSITRDDVQQAAAGPAPAAAVPGPGRRRPGGADSYPRCAQAHGGGGVGQCFHRAARHRVPADRHHRDDERDRAAADAAGLRRRPGVPAAAGGQGPAGRRRPAPDDQLEVGRGGAGDRGQALREPGHRGGHRPRPGRAERQGRAGAVLPDLARALAQLAETARAGKATPADMSGGTITITNVGIFGVDTGTPILTPGETAILAFGQVKDAPWVVDGALAVRKVCTLALSFDHRMVDGDLGSAVLRDVGAMLTDPLRMLRSRCRSTTGWWTVTSARPCCATSARC